RWRRIPFDFQRTTLAGLAPDSATSSGLGRAPPLCNAGLHPDTTWSYKAGEIIHQLIEQPGHAAQLEPKVLYDIWDIVKDPKHNKYLVEKERLLKMFVESENKKNIKRLLTGIELGDMLPSQLLRKLRAFASTDASEKVM
ncbi:uncharacterized protein TNCV_1347651, partial [Trichonephila clavipes]